MGVNRRRCSSSGFSSGMAVACGLKVALPGVLIDVGHRMLSVKQARDGRLARVPLIVIGGELTLPTRHTPSNFYLNNGVRRPLSLWLPEWSVAHAAECNENESDRRCRLYHASPL
jgi:hypothetical protein